MVKMNVSLVFIR